MCLYIRSVQWGRVTYPIELSEIKLSQLQELVVKYN